jgi:DNA end-binding protein Ku
MRFSNELVDADEYTFPARDKVRPQELKMAEQLIENLAEPFDPDRYTDDYRSNLMKIIKAKMKGRKVKLEEPEDPVDTGVLDLMSKLRASLEQGTPKKTARARKGTAKKATAKRARTARRKTA